MGGTALPLPKPQELPVPEDATTGVSPFTDDIEKHEYLRNLRDRTAMNASGHPLEAVTTSPESQIPKTPISINPSAPTLKAGETVNLGDVPKPSLSVEKAKAPKAPLSVEPPDMFQYPEEAADWYEQKNHPGAARTARIIAGVRKGVANTAEGLLSPTNLAFLVATEGTGEIVPVVEELINAGFTTAQVKTAIDTIPQVKTALKNHDSEAAAQAMTEGGIAGAFGVAGVVHGAKGAPEEKAPEENQIQIESIPGIIPIATAPQGGHAGGGVASVEELNRSGRFVAINPKNGAVTDQGKVPDFREGVTGYQVHPNGKIELKAGTETPATKLAAQKYHKEVYGQNRPTITSASGRQMQVPPEHTTGVHDDAIKQGGAIPAGVMKKAGKMQHDLVLFHDPQTGSTLALPEDKVSPKAVSQHIAESRAKFAASSKELQSIPGVMAVRNPQVESVAKGADDFNVSQGRAPITRSQEPLNPELGKKTADEYDKMQHNPNDPQVKASYDAFKKDVRDQWDYATKKMGITFEPSKKDPYNSSREMQDDVENNKHLAFFSTENLPKEHPLAQVDPKTGLTYNQMFRAVHDLFGHAANGNQFGPLGERNAYLDHAQMFRPESLPALTTETHGQNSWTNFGAHLRNAQGEVPAKGEAGYVSPKERPFAEQKAGILPSSVQTNPIWVKKTLDAMDEAPAGALNPRTGTADARGVGIEVYPEARAGRERLDHKPDANDLMSFYNENKEIFTKHPELRIGWDKTNEGWELNIGAAGTREGATKVGNKLDQRAAWDIGKGEEVPLSGKGEKTDFSDYTLQDRLRDLKGENDEGELPIPEAWRFLFDKHGYTWQSTRNHEAGHGVIGDLNGFPIQETRTYNHPKSDGTFASQVFDLSSIAEKMPNVERYKFTVDSAVANLPKLLDTYLSGGMAQEIMDGLPFDKNPGVEGDVAQATDLLKDLGFSPSERQSLLNSSKERIRNVLTNTKVQDIIRQYTEHREATVDETLHSSKARNESMMKKIREVLNGSDKGTVTGASGASRESVAQGDEGNVARTEGSDTTTSFGEPAGVRQSLNPKGSAVPLLTNPIPTEKGAQKSLTPSDKLHQGVTIEHPVVADFQRAMGEWMKKTAGNINEPSAELSRSIRLAHNEVNHWIMENGGEGKGWYKRKTDAAIKVLSKAHPQLQDPAHATIFKALWTAHSYGNDPNVNMTEAEQNLSNLENKGKLEYDKGVQPDGKILHWSGHTGNVYTLAKTQHLIDKDGEAGAAKWLTTKHPWSEIQDKFKDAGLNVSKKSIPLDKDGKTYGAMAFGPKGGAFFLNLNGINDFTTVDIWGARALRRWEGKIGAPDTLTKDYDSNLIVDRPPDAGEIERFHNVIQSVAKKLDLDTDDVQALQWYFEHKLYEVHGVGEKARDYEEAAKNVVNKKGGEPVNALALLKALGQWKSPVQSRGNEGTGGKTQKAGESAVSGNLFKNH